MRHAERFGIYSFVYSRRRPFNPTRLMERVISHLPARHNLALKDQIKVSKATREASPFSTLVRSKGFIWLANNHMDAFLWSHAGSYFEVKKHGMWWSAIDKEDWPSEDVADIEAEVEGKFGDRRQELVFIGIGIDETAMVAELDACLLTDEEMTHYTCARGGKDQRKGPRLGRRDSRSNLPNLRLQDPLEPILPECIQHHLKIGLLCCGGWAFPGSDRPVATAHGLCGSLEAVMREGQAENVPQWIVVGFRCVHNRSPCARNAPRNWAAAPNSPRFQGINWRTRPSLLLRMSSGQTKSREFHRWPVGTVVTRPRLHDTRQRPGL